MSGGLIYYVVYRIRLGKIIPRYTYIRKHSQGTCIILEYTIMIFVNNSNPQCTLRKGVSILCMVGRTSGYMSCFIIIGI
jgi:hypothetical protein